MSTFQIKSKYVVSYLYITDNKSIYREGYVISEFGIKIKNISAGMLYDVNLGTRDYFTYKEAMLNNSLFSYFLQKNGLNVYKSESTRDLVCLDFDFGSRSYEKEHTRLTKLLDEVDEDSKIRIKKAIKKVENNKNTYSEKKRGEIRTEFYENGVNITYRTRDKDGIVKAQQTIRYKMLFRTSAKAKLGQVIFINSKLYNKAYDWLTIGLGNKMSKDNAKIVEMSAYSPLTTSTIIDTLCIPVQDILILKDQDSVFKTLANVVKAEDYIDKQGRAKKKCVVKKEVTEVRNTLWDGMGIIESSYLPEWINGMALLRNHLFKMCGVRGNLQLFFRDWCKEHDYNYETYQVQDMFEKWHYLKDIKIITTDNAIKWKKFIDLMGGTLKSAYSYWCNRIHADGDIWGVVKTDHESKLGDYQQLSYQMINTLPCSKNDVKDISQTSIDYVELLKKDNNEFENFLRKNANEINHYEMLADLYSQNHEFGSCKYFRYEKSEIIKTFVRRLRKGKIFVNGDNLTIFGNPYALLLYSVGGDWKSDNTFIRENDCIQCYTKRFNDREYLTAFRSPHNSPNNICYLHNMYSQLLDKYFDLSKNIMFVNCIGTDVQDRMNGMDFDSDFNLVTNQPTIVKCAKECYTRFPTIVNALQESGITYQNTKTEYANMDNKFSGSKMGIGWSSNLAQLAMTYYWTENNKDNPNEERLQELYDNFVILSVVAQVIIDGCKREYEINGEEEIERISNLPCMKINKINSNGKVVRCDFPKFMKYTKEVKYTEYGKGIPYEDVLIIKNKLNNRINVELQCPMNWLEEWLDKIQGGSTEDTFPTEQFFTKIIGKPNNRQMSKIHTLIEKYDKETKILYLSNENEGEKINIMMKKSNQLINELNKIKIGNIITINRLIETALGLDTGIGVSTKTKGARTKYTRKILNYLYKNNREKFLINFEKSQKITELI